MSKNALVWIERLIWLLIFGGLLLACLGLFLVRGGDPVWGWVLIGKGGTAVAGGVLLIWLRSLWP